MGNSLVGEARATRRPEANRHSKSATAFYRTAQDDDAVLVRLLLDGRRIPDELVDRQRRRLDCVASTADDGRAALEIATLGSDRWADEHERIVAAGRVSLQDGHLAQALHDEWYRVRRSTCIVCLEAGLALFPMDDGSYCHDVCRECAAKYVAGKIRDRSFPVRCPGIGCTAVITPETCRRAGLVFETDAVAAFELGHLTVSLRDAWPGGVFYCPNVSCQLPIDVRGCPGGRASCPYGCRQSICGRCRLSWHRDMSCADVDKMRETMGGLVDGDFQLTRLMQRCRWRQCTQCRHIIEKIDGCKHITCRCGYDFCYKCGLAGHHLFCSPTRS